VSSRDRNILLLGLLVIVLLVVGYYFLFLGPLLNTLGERAQERSAKQAQLSNLQQQVAQLEAVKRNAPETQRQLLELSQRIPAQPEIPSLVVQVEQIAHESGVTQLSIEPHDVQSPPGGGDFSVVPVTMSFEGTYEQMQDFLFRTRNLARLMTVTKVTYCRVRPLGGGGQTQCAAQTTGPSETTSIETTNLQSVEEQLRVQIEAQVYFQPSNAQAGATPATPTPPGTTTSPETTSPEATTAGGTGSSGAR
jgi:type IV pilus assembly protein PilO